jgi:hypothetical protein
MMPSTAATASGTAAGSVTAASSKNPNPVGKFIDETRRDLQCQSGLADPTHPGQRHQPMSLHSGLNLGDLGLAPNEAGDRRPQVPRIPIQRPQRRKVRA